MGYFKGSYREQFYQVLWNWMECETCPVTWNNVPNVMDEMEMKNCSRELIKMQVHNASSAKKIV